MKKIIFYLTLLWLTAWLFPGRALAACNFYQSMTASAKSVSSASLVCTISASATEGIDDAANNEASTANIAALTLSTGTAITINDTGKLYVGSLVLSGGTVAILTGGEIKIGAPIYVADADADGWATNFSLLTASASGKRRLSLMKSFATVDCNDAVYSATNTCCTDTWVCDTCYDTCCATCCTEHSNCGGTCGGCASGPFSGCSNYDVWNAQHTCYCSYCQINYSCDPCSNCNPYSCNCRWECI